MVQKVLWLRRFSVADTWLMQRFDQWKISKICRFNSNSGPLLTAGTRPKNLYISLISQSFPCPAGQVLFQKKKKVLFRSEGPRGYSNGFLASWCILWLVSRRQDKLTETKEKKLHDFSLNRKKFESRNRTNEKEKSRKAEKAEKTRNILSIKKTVPGQRRDLIKVNSIIARHVCLVRQKSSCHCIPDGICEQGPGWQIRQVNLEELTVKIEVMVATKKSLGFTCSS